MQLHKLKKALWTPNNVQNIGVIDNLQPKLLPFYRDELLHSRPTDCHQVKAIGVAHIVTAPDLNLSPFAHETSFVEGTKGGKFREVYCMDISFLQLPSHISTKIKTEAEDWCTDSCRHKYASSGLIMRSAHS